MQSILADLAALEAALGQYATMFDVGGLARTGWTSFMEEFWVLTIAIRRDIWPKDSSAWLYTTTQTMSLCREAAEVYGLLLILHRDTNKDFLYANRRLRLSSCAREEITPRVQLRFVVDERTDRSESLNDWRALLDSNQRRSEEFYVAQQKILGLYQVNHGFMSGKVVQLVMEFHVCDVPGKAVQNAVFALPGRVAELSTTMLNENENLPHNQVRLQYDDSQVFCKSADIMKAFSTVKIPGPTKNITMSMLWTRNSAKALIDAANRDRLKQLDLTIHSTKELVLALEVYASLKFTETVVILMEIGKAWSKYLATLDKRVTLEISQTPPQRLALLTTAGPKNMKQQVDGILLAFNTIDQRVRTTILACPSIYLKTRVDERGTNDFTTVVPLLNVNAQRLASLEMDAVSSMHDFDEKIYWENPTALDLRPVLTVCPNLKLLSVQAAVLTGLLELFERGECQLEALRVQKPSTADAIILMERLGDPTSQLSKYLVEFSTRQNDVEFQAVSLETLKMSKRLRYFRVGRGIPSGANPSATLNNQLLEHHTECLGLIPDIHPIMKNEAPEADAVTTNTNVDGGRSETPVYRQVSLV